MSSWTIEILQIWNGIMIEDASCAIICQKWKCNLWQMSVYKDFVCQPAKKKFHLDIHFRAGYLTVARNLLNLVTIEDSTPSFEEHENIQTVETVINCHIDRMRQHSTLFISPFDPVFVVPYLYKFWVIRHGRYRKIGNWSVVEKSALVWCCVSLRRNSGKQTVAW